MNCSYCKSNPGVKHNSSIWNGFLDQDNGKYVCYKNNCRKTHYLHKSISEHKNLYSEIPVIIN